MKRIYLMNTNSVGFYLQHGFKDAEPHQLIVLYRYKQQCKAIKNQNQFTSNSVHKVDLTLKPRRICNLSSHAKCLDEEKQEADQYHKLMKVTKQDKLFLHQINLIHAGHSYSTEAALLAAIPITQTKLAGKR